MNENDSQCAMEWEGARLDEDRVQEGWVETPMMLGNARHIQPKGN